jgi:predicted peptidase
MIEKDVFAAENPYGMNYKLFYPETLAEDLPLLVFLHGAGERGKEISHLYRHGVPKLLCEGKQIPAVVLCPQCPTWCIWDNVVDKVKGIIDTVVAQFGIKKDRICLTGGSMGGYGTWMMAATYRSFFSAIAPVAGGGIAWRAANYRTTPVRAFCGEKDIDVLPMYSQLMVDAVNEKGGNATYISLPDLGHNDGIDYAYRNTDLLDWLLAQRRTDFTEIPAVCAEYF